MKRSNFTFLFLFALLSFVSTKTWSQTCVQDLNAAVTETCTATISVSSVPTGATSVVLFGPGLPATGSGVTPGMPFPLAGPLGTISAGRYKYVPQSSGLDMCWGYIDFEFKNIPEGLGRKRSIMCVENEFSTANRPLSADAALAAVSGLGCYTTPSNIDVNTSYEGEYCDTITRITTYTAIFPGEFGSTKTVLYSDTLDITPLDTSMILAPVDEVVVECGWGTDPEDVQAYFDRLYGYEGAGVHYAYPYLAKGSKTLKSYPETTVWLQDTIYDVKVELPEGSGNWYVLDTVFTNKREVTTVTEVTTSVPNNLPLLKGETCNIFTKCTDMPFPGCTGEGSTIMRTWTTIDWCNKSTKEMMQWIKVEDTQIPYLKYVDDQIASTEPWICSASHKIVIPGFVNGVNNCTAVTYTFKTTEGTIRNGVVTDIWPTDELITITVRATDACGNYDEIEYYLSVWDLVPPVAVAEDQVRVSVTDGGSISDDGGIAKVYVNAIDAGSHDAGCGEVDACLLLKEEYENPVGVPAFTYYSTSSSRTTTSSAGVFRTGSSGLFLGYLPLQCGDPDRAMYTYSADKFGNLTRTGVIYYNVCEDFVKFCCSDLGDNQVALVVYDAHGNSSHSWSTVTVEDKSSAGWYCTPDYVDCDDLSLFEPKKPFFGGVYCNSFDIKEISRTQSVECGYGYVWVTWGAYDGDTEVSTTTCRYDVEGVAGFDPYTIRWPLHYTGEYAVAKRLECIDGDSDGKVNDIYADYVGVYMNDPLTCSGAVLDEPVWCDVSCSLIASSSEDFEVSASDACKKIIRRHTVIDWCNYIPNGSGTDDENDTHADNFELIENWLGGTACENCPHPSNTLPTTYYAYKEYDSKNGDGFDRDGYYTFDQIIKVIDNDAPVIEGPADYNVEVTGGANAKGDDFDGCSGSAVLTATATDVCAGSELDPSSLSWYIHVEKNGRVIGSPKSVTGATATMTTQVGSPGDVHYIVWTVKDGCGNTTKAETKVTFEDTKAPTPVCIQDISTATMNVSGSSVAIWASDYDFGSFDNCTDVNTYFKDAEGNEVSSLSFSCSDIPNGVSATIELAMYVADESGNEDFCMVTLRIDDNNNICEDVDAGASALISGSVRTEIGDMLESARVSLNKSQVDLTSVEGKYAFGNTPMYNAYEITSSKSDDYLNGVSTLDLVLIQKHVLGIEALNSPYKIIAADINSDTKISALDLVELRKLILGVYTELPNNDSWRFVDAAQTFADATDPFPFTEALSLTLDGPAVDQDFIAAKIGDVSGNAIANSLIAAGTRSAGTLNLEVANAELISGNEVSVAVSAKNFANISALQFTMDVKGLQLVSVESGSINVTADNFAQLDANTITTAWYNASAITTSDVLFTMTFKATANVQLSEALAINSKVTAAAAYTGNSEKLDVDVAFNGVASSEFALFQNEPNPFDNVTTISFQLAEAGAATLTVFDVTGKTVSILRGDYAKGLNSINVTKADLKATGVLYYQLESGAFTATKKMIVIE